MVKRKGYPSNTEWLAYGWPNIIDVRWPTVVFGRWAAVDTTVGSRLGQRWIVVGLLSGHGWANVGSRLGQRRVTVGPTSGHGWDAA